ncbi:integrase family protein [Methylorubrum extorquens CM4]|uniref:Integrase family protein n=1 Tax=Methylorubrum extorquens (strain CM4 / NCIMB 13688) TaxID=440085 RepID=B7KZW5_METC4|nr:integrase family protein [Methylorubrum extorquens CM4]
MKKVADTHHLSQRDGVWYYRRRVPRHLVEAFGREVVQFSLDTRNKAAAKRLREVHDVRFSAEFDRIERERADLEATAGVSASSPSSAAKKGALTADLASKLVRDYVARLDQRAEERILEQGRADSKEQFVEVEANIEDTIEMLANPDDPRGEDQIGLAYLTLHRQAGITEPQYKSKEHDLLWSYLRRGLIELDKRQLARWRDGYTKPFYDPLFGADVPAQVTVAELAEQFLQLKADEGKANGISQKSLDRQAAQVALLREILCDTTSVQAIDYDRCLQVRKVLAQVPSNWTVRYRGLSLLDAIAKAAEEKKPTIGDLTQQQYLAVFREFLSFGAKKQLIAPSLASEVKPLRRSRLAPDERRHSLSLDQIATFFHSEFYKSCTGTAPYLCDAKHGWRFWLPLLCLFTGVRPREACQARTSDVHRTANGTWYLEVTDTGDTEGSKLSRSVKTASSRRRIPLHDQLIRIGFIHFVEGRISDKHSLLFPTLKPNRYGDPAQYPLKRFNETFLPQAVTLVERQTFYSFRHSFRDALRRSEASPDVLVALGWSQGSRVVSDHYGSKLDPDQLAKHINGISYPGLDLSHLWISQGV